MLLPDLVLGGQFVVLLKAVAVVDGRKIVILPGIVECIPGIIGYPSAEIAFGGQLPFFPKRFGIAQGAGHLVRIVVGLISHPPVLLPRNGSKQGGFQALFIPAGTADSCREVDGTALAAEDFSQSEIAGHTHIRLFLVAAFVVPGPVHENAFPRGFGG